MLETSALFVRKAVFAPVGAWVGKVDWLVGDVHIPAVEYGLGWAVLASLQPLQVRQHARVPGLGAQGKPA